MGRNNHSFYKSLWWYSDCEIKQGYASKSAQLFKEPLVTILEPTGPFHEYDPFQSYYSPGGASKGMRSLPYLFAEIDPENKEELLAFSKRFGVPGPFKEFEGWDDWGFQTFDLSNPSVQQRLTTAGGKRAYALQQELIQFSKPVDNTVIGSMTFGQLSEEVYRFKNLLLLAENLAAPHKTKKWIAEPDNPKLLRGWFRPIPANALAATALLEEMLARGCRQLRVRLVNDAQSLAWTLKWESLCLTSLMYLMVALDLQGPGQIQSCPACNRLFLSSRTDKTYCSPECQNRFHSLRYYRAKIQRQSKRSRSEKRPKLKGY